MRMRSSTRRTRSTTRGTALRLALSTALLAAAQACYTYVPIDSQAPAASGRYVEMDITDRGRIGLGDRFGAGVRKINGTVVTQEGNAVVLAVDLVTNIDGELNRWSGDTARVNREFVGYMSERRLSTSKTALLVGAAAAVVVATTASGLIGGGSESDDEPTGPPSQSNRIPNRPHFSRDIQFRLWRIYVR